MPQKFEETSEQWDREETEGKWRLFKETIQGVTEDVARRKKTISVGLTIPEAVKERNEASIKILHHKTRQNVKKEATI